MDVEAFDKHIYSLSLDCCVKGAVPTSDGVLFMDEHRKIFWLGKHPYEQIMEVGTDSKIEHCSIKSLLWGKPQNSLILLDTDTAIIFCLFKQNKLHYLTELNHPAPSEIHSSHSILEENRTIFHLYYNTIKEVHTVSLTFFKENKELLGINKQTTREIEFLCSIDPLVFSEEKLLFREASSCWTAEIGTNDFKSVICIDSRLNLILLEEGCSAQLSNLREKGIQPLSSIDSVSFRDNCLEVTEFSGKRKKIRLYCSFKSTLSQNLLYILGKLTDFTTFSSLFADMISKYLKRLSEKKRTSFEFYLVEFISACISDSVEVNVIPERSSLLIFRQKIDFTLFSNILSELKESLTLFSSDNFSLIDKLLSTLSSTNTEPTRKSIESLISKPKRVTQMRVFSSFTQLILELVSASLQTQIPISFYTLASKTEFISVAPKISFKKRENSIFEAVLANKMFCKHIKSHILLEILKDNLILQVEQRKLLLSPEEERQCLSLLGREDLLLNRGCASAEPLEVSSLPAEQPSNDTRMLEISRLLSAERQSKIPFEYKAILCYNEDMNAAMFYNVSKFKAAFKIQNAVLVGQSAFMVATSKVGSKPLNTMFKFKLNEHYQDGSAVTEVKEYLTANRQWIDYQRGFVQGVKLFFDDKKINRHDILAVDETLKKEEYGGYLSALGFSRNIGELLSSDIYKQMSTKQEIMNICLMTSKAANEYGSGDKVVHRVLVMHLDNQIPQHLRVFMSFEIKAASLFGLALLHANTRNSSLNDIILSKLENNPFDRGCSAEKQYDYFLMLGFALGLNNMGKGLTEKVLSKVSKLKHQSSLRLVQLSLVLALGLSSVDTGDQAVLKMLQLPRNKLEVCSLGVESYYLTALMRNLVCLSDIYANLEYVRASIPAFISKVYHDKHFYHKGISILHKFKYNIAYFSSSTAAAVAMSLKFVSSGNLMVRDLIIGLIEELLGLEFVQVPKYQSNCDFEYSTLMSIDCLNRDFFLSQLCCAIGFVMVGTCDLESLRTMRIVRKRILRENSQLSSIQVMNMGIGFLSLGEGKLSFRRDIKIIPLLVACMLPHLEFDQSKISEEFFQIVRNCYLLAVSKERIGFENISTGENVSVEGTVDSGFGEKKVKFPYSVAEIGSKLKIQVTDRKFKKQVIFLNKLEKSLTKLFVVEEDSPFKENELELWKPSLMFSSLKNTDFEEENLNKMCQRVKIEFEPIKALFGGERLGFVFGCALVLVRMETKQQDSPLELEIRELACIFNEREKFYSRAAVLRKVEILCQRAKIKDIVEYLLRNIEVHLIRNESEYLLMAVRKGSKVIADFFNVSPAELQGLTGLEHSNREMKMNTLLRTFNGRIALRMMEVI